MTQNQANIIKNVRLILMNTTFKNVYKITI